MATKQFLFLIVVFILFIQSSTVIFKNCGGQNPSAKKVRVTNCSDTNTCELHYGKTSIIEVDFIADKAVNTLAAIVHYDIVVYVPIPLLNPDACKESGIICPLKKDRLYTYKSPIPVEKSFPNLRAILKWQLRDDTGQDVVCILVPVEIVN